MKKYFSLASALMLALCMGMTSCSNDLDEVVTEEQQPQLHKLHLTASVPQSSETRSYVEGVAGSDVIKITGWRDGDVIYGIYPVITDDMGFMKTGTLGRLAFEFNGTTKEFESDLTGVNAEDIRYFIYGDFDFTKGYGGGYSYDSYAGGEDLYQYFFLNDPDNPLQIDVAGNSSKIPMWGKASVQAGQLTTDMKLADGMALLCVHNDSEAPIEVRLGYRYSYSNGTVYSYYFTIPYLNFNVSGLAGDEFCQYFLQSDEDRAKAACTTIPEGEKAYIPVRILSHITYDVKVMINEQTHDNAIKSKVENTFVAGKVYKVIYTGE